MAGRHHRSHQRQAIYPPLARGAGALFTYAECAGPAPVVAIGKKMHERFRDGQRVLDELLLLGFTPFLVVEVKSEKGAGDGGQS